MIRELPDSYRPTSESAARSRHPEQLVNGRLSTRGAWRCIISSTGEPRRLILGLERRANVKFVFSHTSSSSHPETMAALGLAARPAFHCHHSASGEEGLPTPRRLGRRREAFHRYLHARYGSKDLLSGRKSRTSESVYSRCCSPGLLGFHCRRLVLERGNYLPCP